MVEIGRIQHSIDRYGERFLDRVYTAPSRPIACASATPAESFAARFAAKEAGAKALGTGISYGVSWLEIRGGPRAERKADAAVSWARRPNCRAAGRAHAALSITHTAELAMASVVLEDWELGSAVFWYPQGVDCIHSCKRSSVPSRKEIQWSQLRVGALVLAATGRADRAHLPHVRLHRRAVCPQDHSPLLLRKRRRAQGWRAGHAGRRHHRQRDSCPRCSRSQPHAGRSHHAGGRTSSCATCTPTPPPRLPRPAFWATATSISIQPMPPGPLRQTTRN